MDSGVGTTQYDDLLFRIRVADALCPTAMVHGTWVKHSGHEIELPDALCLECRILISVDGTTLCRCGWHKVDPLHWFQQEGAGTEYIVSRGMCHGLCCAIRA